MITNLSLIKSFFCTARTIFDCFSCILLQLAHGIYIRTVKDRFVFCHCHSVSHSHSHKAYQQCFPSSSVQGAKYLFFVSSRSVKTRELTFAQFVYFLRKVCLFFNF